MEKVQKQVSIAYNLRTTQERNIFVITIKFCVVWHGMSTFEKFFENLRLAGVQFLRPKSHEKAPPKYPQYVSTSDPRSEGAKKADNFDVFWDSLFKISDFLSR